MPSPQPSEAAVEVTRAIDLVAAIEQFGQRLVSDPEHEIICMGKDALHNAVEEELAPALRAQVLEEVRDWLGSDGEYDALTAIQADLEANPQLVPKVDVPQRLLRALRAAVDRFATLTTEDS